MTSLRSVPAVRHTPPAAPPAAAHPRARLGSDDRVLICGAGPAGLTAAYLLSRGGSQVTVLEAESQVGGLARTCRYKDFGFDIGGHRFFTKISAVQALWEELLGDDLIDVPRLSRIHYEGRFFHYPLRPTSALFGLGLWRTSRVLLSYLRSRLRPHRAENNFEEWVSNRFGSELYRIFFKTYTEKVWGVPCTEIRAEWAAQRIQGLSLARAIMAASPIQRRSSGIRTLIDQFKYPREGPGQMWERCAALVEAQGGALHLEHRVEGFELQGRRVTAAVVSGPSGTRRVEAEHFVSTLSLRALVRAFGDKAPSAVRAAAERLSYRDFIIVALVIDRAGVFPDNWIYVHTPGVMVGRVQNFNNWSAALVPQPNTTLLGMEYFCSKGDAIWSRSDEELRALATEELALLGLAPGARVVDGTVVRVLEAYPVYDSTYRESLQVVREFLDTLENFHTVGRNGMHKYNNQDHSMFTAMLTVDNLRGASHDVWAVNSDFEYQEEVRLNGSPGAATGAAGAYARG